MTILFYPDKVDDERISRMYRILRGCSDIAYHNDPSKPHDVHIFWSYTRHSIIPDKITLTAPNVINRGCWDIGKQKVNDIFNDISVDPLTYKGLCVEKYDRQGLHQHHKVVKCPVQPKEDYVYQQFIEDREDGYYIRYRVYYAGRITHVVKFYQKNPLKTQIIKTELIPKQQLFTPEQEQDFNSKCSKFGFSLGEVDVMWDGKPVVIDVNNVAGGGFIEGYTNMPYTEEVDNEIIKYLWGIKTQRGCSQRRII